MHNKQSDIPKIIGLLDKIAGNLRPATCSWSVCDPVEGHQASLCIPGRHVSMKANLERTLAATGLTGGGPRLVDEGAHGALPAGMAFGSPQCSSSCFRGNISAMKKLLHRQLKEATPPRVHRLLRIKCRVLTSVQQAETAEADRSRSWSFYVCRAQVKGFPLKLDV